jgi:hypothetical protein
MRAVLGTALTFINNFVIGYQAWLNYKLPSLSKLFLSRCISVASFAMRCTCPEVRSNTAVP